MKEINKTIKENINDLGGYGQGMDDREKKAINNNKSISIDFINKKRNNYSKNKKLKNPGITKFNLHSYFIYDMSKPSDYILNIENKNNIKLNEKEYEKLKEEINIINNLYNKNEKEKYVLIQESEINSINNFFDVDTNELKEVVWAKNF